jgi:hypothetical protein
LVTRFFVRHIISFGVFYLIIRALGYDLYQRGGWSDVGIGLAIWFVIGAERLYLELKQNQDLRKTLSANGDLSSLPPRWHIRETKVIRIHSIPVALIGILILTLGIKFPKFEVPSWFGAIFFGIALVFLIFADKLARTPEVEPMVKNVIPPGFKASE